MALVVRRWRRQMEASDFARIRLRRKRSVDRLSRARCIGFEKTDN
jgi:hypothetical protein